MKTLLSMIAITVLCGWTQKRFVDEFNDPTGQRYILRTAYGNTSNRYVTMRAWSYLLVVTASNQVQIIGIKPITGTEGFTVRVRSSLGTRTLGFSHTPYHDEDRLVLSYKASRQLISILKRAVGSVKISVTEATRYVPSRYYLKVNANGFTKAYRRLR